MVLPNEALEPHERGGHICGKLQYSLYGTRGAAQNWKDASSKFLCDLGFTRGLSSPCIFFHAKSNRVTVLHGDDFTTLGCDNALRWLASEFQDIFKLKVRGILGPEKMIATR